MQTNNLNKRDVQGRVKSVFKKVKPKKPKKAKKAAKTRSTGAGFIPKKKPKNTLKSKLEAKIRKECKPAKKTKTVEVILTSPASESFRCKMAANSLDIDVKKKLTHHLKIQNVDLEGHFNIGLILGASGSGKTTFAQKAFGSLFPDLFDSLVKPDLPIIDQFPTDLSYEDCANLLTGVGLNSVPCWIRPAKTLSNGQKSRAEAALILADGNDRIHLIDEWTSVVDRTVAKVMSHCVQKRIRKFDRSLVLLSCHYDVVDWLDPDWIIDCNEEKFTDRRLLRPEQRKRRETLAFTVREIDSSTWKNYSKYHYLTERLPGGRSYFYGIFHGKNQIGFKCFTNYCPIRPGTVPIFHSNRVVVHPDYGGMGLGIHLINASSKLFLEKLKNKVSIHAAFSSTPIYRAMSKDKNWKFKTLKYKIGKAHNGGQMLGRQGGGVRTNVKLFSFEYRPV